MDKALQAILQSSNPSDNNNIRKQTSIGLKPPVKKKARPSKASLEAKKAAIATKNSLEYRAKIEKLVSLWQEKISVPCTSNTLIQASRYITFQNYQQVIDERNSQKLCGYPLCSNPSIEASAKFKISLKTREILNTSESDLYCSKRCMAASKYYALQIPIDPPYLRSREEILNIELFPHISEQTIKTETRNKSTLQDIEWYKNHLMSGFLGNIPSGPPNKIEIFETPPHEIIPQTYIEANKSNLTQSPKTEKLDEKITKERFDKALALNQLNSETNNKEKVKSKIDINVGQNNFSELIPSRKANSDKNTSSDAIDSLDYSISKLCINDGEKSERDEDEDKIKSEITLPSTSAKNASYSDDLGSLKEKHRKSVAKAKKQQLLSFFGQTWLILDKLCSNETKEFFDTKRNNTNISSYSMASPFASDNISAEKLLEIQQKQILQNAVLQNLTFMKKICYISPVIEDDIVKVFSTFTVDKSVSSISTTYLAAIILAIINTLLITANFELDLTHSKSESNASTLNKATSEDKISVSKKELKHRNLIEINYEGTCSDNRAAYLKLADSYKLNIVELDYLSKRFFSNY
ncbi:hypothetical protein BB561_000763 [Smittium simulii]|uniref:RNA polymerase II subunit B1 CTD phosphatase RPAP2 homolog n=1 Tax=Smittium simulii TaxID=133385 RepID=A0A2T9YXP9_9FUNG|nr:hypothetical protein BB561_000763 [Smittium simulii]